MQMNLGGGILTDDMCNFEKVALNDQVEKWGRLKGSQWGGCICFDSITISIDTWLFMANS